MEKVINDTFYDKRRNLIANPYLPATNLEKLGIYRILSPPFHNILALLPAFHIKKAKKNGRLPAFAPIKKVLRFFYDIKFLCLEVKPKRIGCETRTVFFI